MLFVVLMVLSLFSAVAHEVWSGQYSVQHWYLGFSGYFQQLHCSLFNAKSHSNKTENQSEKMVMLHIVT